MCQRYKDRHRCDGGSNTTSTNITSSTYITSVQMTSSKVNLTVSSSPFHQTFFLSPSNVSHCLKNIFACSVPPHFISHLPRGYPDTASLPIGAMFPPSLGAFAYAIPPSGGVYLLNSYPTFRSQLKRHFLKEASLSLCLDQPSPPPYY